MNIEHFLNPIARNISLQQLLLALLAMRVCKYHGQFHTMVEFNSDRFHQAIRLGFDQECYSLAIKSSACHMNGFDQQPPPDSAFPDVAACKDLIQKQIQLKDFLGLVHGTSNFCSSFGPAERQCMCSLYHYTSSFYERRSFR